MSTTTSRRQFFAGMAPSAAASLAFPALLNAATDADAWWKLVRNHFSFPEERVPMNAANLAPSPRAVAERVADLTRDTDYDCSFRNREKFSRLLESSRSKTASMIGASPDEVALVRNTSEANNIINNGFPLKSGDEVVIWDQNHPTNNVAWDVRAARFGLVVKRVSTPVAPKSAADLIAPFEQAITSRSRLLSLTHLSNTTGIRLPVKELCDIAHRRGLYVHVDGAQTWGALQVNVRDLGCDSYSASAHKWFMGPREVGLLYVRKDRIPTIWPNTVAPGWGNDAEPDVSGARKFESLGQRDDARLAAIEVCANFHATVGSAKIETRMLELADALKSRARALDIRTATPMEPSLSGGVVILQADAKRAQQAYQTLDLKHGIAGAATGGVRLCPHVYNTIEHIDRAIEGLKSVRHLFV